MDELIEKLKHRISSGQYQSEAAVREAIVLPILQKLGWDVFDPEIVFREFNLSGRRVDYALSVTPPRKSVFVEVKAINNASGGDKQLFEYAYHEGIPFAILTDGREWNFYLPGEQGSYDERRVQKLDLIERSTSDVSATLKKYLEFSRVQSGEAITSARADYQNISRRKLAANQISKAWLELVNEPDTLLIDLIAEKTEALCGYRPASEDVEEFLTKELCGHAAPVFSPPKHPIAEPKARPTAAPVSERGVSYSVLGQHRTASKAVDALVDILRTLAGRNPGFLSALAPIVRGTRRNHLARSREAVYPEKPELQEYAVEFVPGWWLGTNIANREKMRIITKACELEHLTLGRDIIINLPNA